MVADTVSKSPIVFEIFLEEALKLCLYYLVFGLEATFILMPLLDHRSAKEQDGKKDLVRLVGPSGFEMILTRFAEPVAI